MQKHVAIAIGLSFLPVGVSAMPPAEPPAGALVSRAAVRGTSNLLARLRRHMAQATGFTGVTVPSPAGPVGFGGLGGLPGITSMPEAGTTSGGEPIEILGQGFFPTAHVVVHWGALELHAEDLASVENDRIVLAAPSGSVGSVDVRVATPFGTSGAWSYEYAPGGPAPVAYYQTSSTWVLDPTAGEWGPDGRFYVGSASGQLTALEYDDDWNLVSASTYGGVSTQPNPAICGVTFSPFDGVDPVRAYVAHGKLYAQGGGSFAGEAPYSGQVSVLEGPDFDTPLPVITGLPISNHDHLINGMQFDHNGDLLVTVGGTTNGGVTWPLIGDIPESPLSGAIIKAELSRGDFDGAVRYLNPVTGLEDEHSDDQVHGGEYLLAPGSGVYVHAPGFRNAYDLVLHTNRNLYATDNGPNAGYGPASTGPASEGAHPQTPDEVMLVEYDNYYGHPNRNRGRFDARQNVYYGTGEPPLPGVFTPELTTVPSSTNGICEFRSEAFGGAMRGELIAQRWGEYVRRIRLSADGRKAEAVQTFGPYSGALDVQMGPGGVLMLVHYTADAVRVWAPDDAAAVGVKATDITPWRAPASGGQPFEIGGHGFGSADQILVRIDGIPATLTRVSPTRIEGLFPAALPPTSTELVDVVVTKTIDGVSYSTTLAEAVRRTGPIGSEPGFWMPGTGAPVNLGPSTCAELGGLMLAMADDDSTTWACNLNTGAWPGQRAPRLFAGSRHSAEVVDGKLYLIGGSGAGSEGKLQIYDPAADAWSEGAALPWLGASVQTAAIDGKIYAAGGFVGATTVDDAAVYDPLADAWTAIASQPTGMGRNGAAAGTDGDRFWIFGGRGNGSGDGGWVANGFDHVQVYDPATDAWETSADPGTSLVPMPIGRGGTGKAIWHQRELYVFGGETSDGPGAEASGVYARVDVYDPARNTWRRDADMPTPRQGFFPVLFQSRIWVAGGGTAAGGSPTNVLEIFNHQ